MSIAYYEIWRAEGSSESTFSLVGTSTSKDYTDTDVVLGTVYCYYIVAVDSTFTKSDPSPKACVLYVEITPPSAGDAVFAKENVICVYREGDGDSYAYAQKYQQLRGLEDFQLVSVPCSSTEILENYTTFQDEVETPLIQSLISFPLNERNIYGIVLMPFVPGGFRDGSDVISSTSRLSRIFFPFSKDTLNPLYNRQVFKRFDGTDAGFALVCSRIDGPPIVVDSWFANIEDAQSRFTISGSFFIDAYSAYTFDGVLEYTNDLLDFQNGYIDRLNLNIQSTNEPPVGKDAFFPKIQEDSFFWGWGSDGGSTTFFGNTTNIRTFFYNADFNGALTMRDIDSTKWPLLAIRNGYIATAGNLSGTTTANFLRPFPFTDALFRGATLGEAFLFSQPYFDSGVACFGDPLSVFSFPSLVSASQVQLINPDESWQKMEECLAQSIVCLFRKTNKLKEIRDHVVGGKDLQVQLELDYKFDALYNSFDETSWKTTYHNLTNSLMNFGVDRNATSLPFFYPNLNQYLTYTGGKVSEIVLETLQDNNLLNDIESSNIDLTGSWTFESTLQSNPGSFRFYYLELQIARNREDFDEGLILLTKDTFVDSTNWYYEDYNGVFQPMSSTGVTSSFEGKKYRYVSNEAEILERGQFYWFRVRQKDELQNFDWSYFKQIIYK